MDYAPTSTKQIFTHTYVKKMTIIQKWLQFLDCCCIVTLQKIECSLVRRFADVKKRDLLRWDGSHSAEVTENINLGYSQDQGYS